MMKCLFAGCFLLACVGLSLANSTPRLRETSWQPTTPNAGLGSALTEGPERVAGFFRLNRTYAAEMFYFYFQSRQDKSDDPLLIWLTGGPGCSSELAVFKENGPYVLTKNGSVEEREYAWDVTSNIIFVDSPINVGYSYSDDPRDRVFDEKTVAADLLDFLEEFFLARPELKDRDFFVTGESYAGHYIPVVTHHIWDTNKAKPEGERINLAGMAIGNGMTVPELQFGAYSEFAKQRELISPSEADGIKQLWPACKFGIHVCNMGIPVLSDLFCQGSLYFCQITQFQAVMGLAGNFNVYDIRKECIGPLCYDFSDIDEYFNREDVRKQLGVPADRGWTECDMSVNADFHSDFMLNYGTLLPPMMADGVRVMIYIGMQDFICNEVGNRWWVEALEWERAADWNAAPREDWEVDGEKAGTSQVAEPLTFVTVDDAGHMVPMDQAKNALDMITRFTRGEDFGSRHSAKLLTATSRQQETVTAA